MLYTTTINIAQDVEMSEELEGTNECNPGLRSEVQKIYKEIFETSKEKKKHRRRDKIDGQGRDRERVLKKNERSQKKKKIGPIQSPETDATGKQ